MANQQNPSKPEGTRMATAAATQIQPLADRIVVKPLEETEQMRGGLYIPDTAKEKPQQGEVVAVGPGKMTDDGKRVEPEVKTGDRVLYGKYSGTEVTLGDEQYLILRESDVLAVIKS
jgi:chaperonin GroES